MPAKFVVPVPGGADIEAVRYGSAGAPPTLVLAHGAGAGQQSAFMVAFASAMAARGVEVVTFDFPYLQRGRRTPDPPGVLEETWRRLIRHLLADSPGRAARLAIGGKSMGGRIASQVLATPIAAEPGAAPSDDLRGSVAGLVLLGYPLHPPRQPERLRVAHLPALATPTLVIQGELDQFGTEHEVRAAFAVVPAPVTWWIVPQGDHSFRTSRARENTETIAAVHDRVAAWIHARDRASTGEAGRHA